MLECDPALVENALSTLRDELAASDRGIQLREVAGGWRLFTHPALSRASSSSTCSRGTRASSGAAMETLAVVAYAQPVTRAGVASVRGVNSDSSINSLVEKGLVREAGVADTPGNPVLYATTRAFLEKFRIALDRRSAPLDDFAPDDETRRLITERLSATRDEAAVTDEQARLMAEGLIYGDDSDEGPLSASGFRRRSRRRFSRASAKRSLRRRLLRDASSREAMFAEAIASTLGVVDKIDFDSLVFETEDE